MTEHNHEEQNACSHSTAAEEAIHRIEITIHELHEMVHKLPWYHFPKKYYMAGMLASFVMVHKLLCDLTDRYNNDRGTLN